MAGVGLVWDLLAKDQASPAFLRVAGAADKAATSTARASAGLTASVARMGKLGATLTKRVTLPLVALAAMSVDQAAKYQKSLNTIQVVTGQTDRQMSLAAKGLEAVATKTGTSLGQLTDGLYMVEKGGFRGSKALGIVQAAAEGAKAEGVDLGTATQALTSIMASYGKSLRDPIAAENEIIKGSGLAKTTMADFAASLSNVVPVAASLKIPFSDVAAAIATMTQHGETAQHATENLRNLITSLAGQNNVASQAMQQLNINTVRVSKNLGKPGVGLVGTLDYVLGRVQHLSHGGMLVVDTFKHASLATKSLHKELAAMDPALRTQSKGLLSGSVSIKQYTKDAKSLGGRAGAMALDFLGLYKSSQGFSNLVKTGKGNVQTYAAALQKMLGGVTGMNVALQLSGESAKTFHRDAKQVGDAAKETGGDVLGWAKTSGTLSTKLDKAKASLQVMAVELGTALLPAIGKLADAGAKAVHWFDGLSGTQKKVLGWSLGVVAALGPILSIGSRLALVGRGIGTFVGGVGTTLGKFAGASEATAGRISGAMRGMTAAMTGVAIGAAFGMLTRNSGNTAKTLSVLGSAAAGAALGFGAGGGIGALIGGVAGGLSSLVVSWTGEGDAAKAAAQRAVQSLSDQKAAADSLYTSLQQVNGSYSKGNTVKNDALEQLRAKKLLVPLTQGGLDPSSLLRITLGFNVGKRAYEQYATAISHLSATQVAALDAIDKGAGQGEREWELYNQAQGKTVVTSKLLAGGLKNLGREFLNVKEGFAGSRIVTSFTAAAVRNSAVLKENVAWLGKVATSELRHGKSVSAVTKEYAANKAALLNQLMVMGANGTVVQEMIGRYDKLTRARILKIATDAAQAKVRRLQDQIDSLKQSHQPGVDARIEKLQAKLATARGLLSNLTDKTIAVNATGNADSVLGSLLSQIETINSTPVIVKTGTGVIATGGNAGVLGAGTKTHHPARGGYIAGPGTGTSDSIPAMLSNGEYVINARQTSKHRLLLHAINSGIKGFATGGAVGHPDQSKLSSTVSTAIGNVGSAPTSKFNVTDVGITRISGQIRHAIAVLNAEVAKGLSKAAAAKYRHEIAAYIREANRQLGALRLKVRTSDLAALRRGLKGTVDDTRTAFQQLITDMQHIGAPTAAIKEAQQAESKLLGIQSRLASARSYRSTVMDTLRGGFDSTHYGSVTDLHQALAGQTGQNNTYAKELTSLRGRSKGNKALTGYINQLAQSGQTATLETLYGSSKAELGQIGKDVGAYDKSVLTGGNAAEESKYGQSVDKMAHGQAVLAGAIAKLATAIAKSENKPAVLDAKQHKHHTDKHIEQALSELTRLLS